MKNKLAFIGLLSFFSAISFSLRAQISFEYSFPDASMKLYMVNLEASGMKYVILNRLDTLSRSIQFYNLDHSIWKTIDCNSLPMFTYCGPIPGKNAYFVPLYISEHLFDLDDDVEFLYYTNTDCKMFTGVYNEDGSPLLEVDSAGPLVQVMIPQTYRPIYSTPEGTKMILSIKNKDARVYSLPGDLSTSIDQMIPDDGGSFMVSPNPSFYETKIQFTLPEGVNEARITVTSLQGITIKSYRVDRTFGELMINHSDAAPGTYLYTLSHGDEILASRKIVLMK